MIAASAPYPFAAPLSILEVIEQAIPGCLLRGQKRTFGGIDDIFQLERARRLRRRRSARSHDLDL